MITRVDKVTILVSSQDAAKAFWTQKLGFVVTVEQPMGPGATWVEVAPDGDDLTSIVLYPKEMMLAQNPDAVHHPLVMFATDDVEADWTRLKANGVDVANIQTMPYGKMFNFKDNDGNAYMVRGH